MVADGFTRSSAADRNGIIISLQVIANTPRVATDPRLFCWDRGTLKRGTLHRKKLGTKGLNFSERQRTQPPPAQYLQKF
jgi:hypothetical protein